MQIRYETARTMGYKGTPIGLLDAEANLKFGAKYLRGAYLVAGYNAERAISLYRSGYYYHAKHAGLLEETGLR
jgi:soluble lytic murein transglycosylase-like protein